MRKHLRLFLLIVVLSSLSTHSTSAGDLEAEVKEQRAVVEKLVTRVEAQEARMDTLEKSLALGPSPERNPPKPRSTVGPAAAADWKNPENSKRIKVGMSESQVRAILGPPTIVEGSTWYYEGSVFRSATVTGNIYWGSHRVLVITEPVW